MEDTNMRKTKKLLPEDTVIIINQYPVGEYRAFFQQATGMEKIVTVCKDFQTWLFTQAGKTLKEALEEYHHPTSKDMEAFLLERRFNHLTDLDKTFLVAFDKAINRLGYDFGGVIGSGFSAGCPLMIVYGKTGVKSRPCAARIYINENGITLRLFLNKIEIHRSYIENAPALIKEVFTNDNESCNTCSFRDGKCKYNYTKTYTIDGRLINKCDAKAFIFFNPSVDKLPDYMGLLEEFYPVKNK
jgi:hypothetical protein